MRLRWWRGIPAGNNRQAFFARTDNYHFGVEKIDHPHVAGGDHPRGAKEQEKEENYNDDSGESSRVHAA